MLSLNSILQISSTRVIELKRQFMEELTGKYLNYINEETVLNLGQCLIFQERNIQVPLYVECSDTTKRYIIRNKKRGTGLTAELINK